MTLEHRSNDEWIAALRGLGPRSAEVVGMLEGYLQRVLRRVLHGRIPTEDVTELVQESLMRIVASLASFRGDSAFPTWATGIATRVAFTELRRRHVREERRQEFDGVLDDVRQLASRNTPAPEAAMSRSQLTAALEHAIATRLTERQRVAVLAELRGIPTIEIAERLQTNQNALYKLTHDARKKLRQALLEQGFTADSIHEHASEAVR